MSSKQVLAFQECFEVVEDPRVLRRCDHPLHSILFLIVSAVISGADGPVDIEDFGKEKKGWLEKFIKLPHGIPSHDTIGRILSSFKPAQFQQALMDWIGRLRSEHRSDGPIVVPIDGKTARGSYTDAGKSNALHIVNELRSTFRHEPAQTGNFAFKFERQTKTRGLEHGFPRKTIV